MKQIAIFDELYNISSAFVEFDSVYNTFNNGDIYKSLPGGKSQYPEGGYYKMVLSHMNDAISKKPHLNKFMRDAMTVAPEALNNMYIFDKETKEFDFFATTVGEMKQAIDSCSGLNDLLVGKEVFVGDGLWDYMTGCRKILEKMLEVLEGAVKVIETFKTEKNKAPYAVLHYDPYVKDVVSKHMLGTLSDPITSGTNYRTMARKMSERLGELAFAVTKYAPA